MPAYLVAEVSVEDPERYEEYKRLALASIERHGGTYRARGGTVDSLEGEPAAGRVVIVEFPDLETARAWYHSDDYQPVAEIRRATSTSRVFIVDGVAP